MPEGRPLYASIFIVIAIVLFIIAACLWMGTFTSSDPNTPFALAAWGLASFAAGHIFA